MTFLNPLYLFGLLAAGIPIVIHLLTRRRPKRITFPSVEFLREVNVAQLRRFRLREFLLLALRTLAIALLALALSKPALKGALGAGAGQATSSVVLLIDRSASMAAVEGRETLADRAKARARAVLASLDPGDEVQVIAFDARPEALFPQPTGDLTRVGAMVETIEPRPYTTDLDAAVGRGLVALRASGLSFLMITLAIGQVLWGLAFRWAAVTGGDNGLSGLTRPSPFGLNLDSAAAFYYFTLAIASAAAVAMTLLVRSAFGALMRGARDQPRRMSALGHNVWLVRYLAFVASGFFGGVAGPQFVWYHKFVHPHSLSLTSSAETLLMVIAGGSGTLAGPIVGATIVVLLKNYVSAYVERWTMLLGFVFLMIVLFMPDGLVPGLRRAWSSAAGKLAGRRP